MRRIPPLVIISVVLAIIPFFWFKPGQVNLGGDSSRLYFYDPVNYLKNFALYDISPTGIGFENISYFFIPFTLMLAFFKLFIGSTWLLITLFHSFMLVTCFLSVRGIMKELLSETKKERKKIVEFTAVAAGLLYTLDPLLGPNWDKAIASHNQLFLNPLLFYLLLKFIHTKKSMYPLIAILMSFLFAINFSFVSAPPFFAFYPIALAFLFLYAYFVLKTRLPVFKIILFFFLFTGVQTFHLLPQISLLLDKSGATFHQVFVSNEVGNFIGNLDTVKLSRTTIGISSFSGLSFLHFLFSLIIVVGFYFSQRNVLSVVQRKIYLLVGLFFLLMLFLVTAKITPLSVELYKQLFKLPGFGMFRHFYGQFLYVYFFSYVVVFGYSLYQVLLYVKGRIRMGVYCVVIGVIVVSSIPFIRGDMVNLVMFQSEGVRVPFTMDTEFERVLEYLRKDKSDGKVLTLPLTAFGYQMLKGVDEGVYQGPSMIGYLTGKKDFSGIGDFEPFQEEFLKMAKRRDFESINRLFSMLNIKYIFYNSDPYLYDKFPGFPYFGMREYFPTLLSVKNFIDELGTEEINNFSAKLHLYKIKKPGSHLIFASSTKVFTTKTFLSSELLPQGKNVLMNMPATSLIEKADGIVIEVGKNDTIFERRASPFGVPYIVQKLTSPLYPFVSWREKRSLNRLTSYDDYLDRSIFLAEKRVGELQKWSSEIKILGNVSTLEYTQKWQEPAFWQIYKTDAYNSWEISLVRYYTTMNSLINKTKAKNDSIYPLFVNKASVATGLLAHEYKILNAITISNQSKQKQLYLQKIVTELFKNLRKNLNITLSDFTTLSYLVSIPQDGTYEILVDSKVKNVLPPNTTLSIKGKTYNPEASSSEAGLWIKYGSVSLQKNSHRLSVTFTPLLETTNTWKTTGKNSGASSKISINQRVFQANTLEKKIQNLGPDYYLLSFDYKTQRQPFTLHISEEKSSFSGTIINPFDDIMESQKSQKYFKMISPGTSSIAEVIQIKQSGEQKDSSTTLDVNNFYFIPVYYPQILFKKIVSQNKKESLPTVSYTKVNPVKYTISVSDAQKPYTLVFSNAFNKNWKISMSDGKDKNLLDTIFKEKSLNFIPENKHILVNSYANGWFINPEDVQGKKKYTLILEMTSQRYFYQGMIISLVAVFLCLLWTGIISIKLLIKKNTRF